MKNKRADTLYCGVRKSKIEEAIPTLNEESLNLFMGYIKERYKIHIRKDIQLKKPPYTKNKILKKYIFTNVRREHDKETKWLLQNITENEFLTYRQKTLNSILFRMFNKHETMEIMDGPFKFGSLWSYTAARNKLLSYSKEHPDYVFFTGAFITAGLKNAAKSRYPKESFMPGCILRYISDINRSELVPDLLACKNQKQVFNRLRAEEGIGDFLAYQIFVDLTYIKEFPFSENEFTIAGPGCKNGLNFLFEDRDGMSYEECLFWLRDNWYSFSDNKVFFDPEKEMIDLKHYDRKMNVMSLENCFCEFSKYYRAVKHIGRPNRTYASRLKAASQVEKGDPKKEETLISRDFSVPYKLLQGDCLELMKGVPDGSIDMILCDLPYGTTRNRWDSALPLDKLWVEYKRIIKDNGVITLFAQTPFDKALGASNLSMLKYEWIWKKDNITGFLNAKIAPLKIHENVLIFYKNSPTYNPQMRVGFKPYSTKTSGRSSNYGKQRTVAIVNKGERYPIDVLEFKRDKEKIHLTQKPVALLEYLIKTYTVEGETVLDNCMGSGSTGVACANTGRRFIGMELEENYFEIAKQRIEEAFHGQEERE